MGGGYSKVPVNDKYSQYNNQTQQGIAQMELLIPSWACSDEAYGFAVDHPFYDEVVGPAVPLSRRVAALAAPTQTLMFCAVYLGSECSGEGLAFYPKWVWACLLPYACLRSWAEIDALRYYLPVYGANAIRFGIQTPFKVLTIGSPFLLWYGFYITVSTLNLLDLGTDSAFTATTIKAMTCSGSQVQDVWAQTWAKTFFGKIGLPVINLIYLVSGAFVFSMIQQIVPWIQALPWFQTFRGQIEYKLSVGKQGEICNCCGEKLGENEQLSLLSEASGFASIQALSTGAAIFQIQNNKGCYAEPEHLIPIFRSVCQTMVSRVYYSFILETCVQVNIQGTLFAINYYISPSNPAARLQGLASIGLSVAMAFMKLSEAATFFKAVESVKCLMETNDYRRKYRLAVEEGGEYKAHNELIKLKTRSACIVCFGCVVMIVSLVYAAAKLVGAYLCEDAVWNVTGCVDMQSDSRSSL